MSGDAVNLAEAPIVDRSGGVGGMKRLLLLSGVLLLLAGAFALVGERVSGVMLLSIFALLAMIGILAIFAVAIGIVRIGSRSSEGALAREFLDSLPEGALITDRKGRIIYANRAYGDITGARDAAQVRTLERLLARESEASEDVYHLANLAREAGTGEREIRLSHGLGNPQDTEPHWYRIRVRPLGGHSGSAIWQIADVTVERARQEGFFRDLQHAIDYLDHAPAGFFASDEKGRIVYLNATLADWLGVDLASFRPGARSVSDLVQASARPLLESAAGAGEAGHATIDLDFVKSDGHTLPVRVLRRAPANAGPHSKAAHNLVLSRSMRADGAGTLEAAEARFTRFFNSSPMAIAALDRQGAIVRANAAFTKLFGQAESGRPAHLDAVVAERGRDEVMRVFGAAVGGQAAVPPVDAFASGAGERSVRLYISAVADSGAGTSEDAREAAILYAIDTTEQRALEDQFAKAQKMQAVGTLAGGIAHDFNNVLTIISTSVDFLLLNHRTGDPSFQDLLLIKQNTNRAASLVRQLLAYSRRQTMRPKMLNLTDVIADMHLLLKRVSGDLVKLERHHARDLWPVMADIGQFEQVITNLVQNARDAIDGSGGTITISTRNVSAKEAEEFSYDEMPSGDYVLVEVSDTGSGMPKEVADRIFEPFFTTKEIGKGTGLGLSMVYGIVKQSSGFIFVESREGAGTAFRIFLPRHMPSETETALRDTAAGGMQKPVDLSGTASILLVEDEDHVRAGNKRALAMRGYEVHEAASGLEALEVMEAVGGKIDLVVSDVVMPEMDGPTLLRELRKKRPEMKFIFVSGYAEDAFAKNLPEGEQFGFLPKPFSLRELAVAVREALDN